MDVVYGLIPMMLIFGFLVVLVFIWMAKSGHFDDLDGAAHSIFMEDEDTPPSDERTSESEKEPSKTSHQKVDEDGQNQDKNHRS